MTRLTALVSGTSFALAAAVIASPSSAALRIATYNVDADTDRNGDTFIDSADATYGVDALARVIQAMGTHSLAGRAQPLDAIALQELYANPATTITPLLTKLNAFYGAGTYAFSQPAGAGNSSAVGNGPSGLIYNTKTVQVTGTATVGSVSSQGAARLPLRYKLKAINESTNNEFYLYTVHSKAGSFNAETNGTTNGMRRTIENDAMRIDADSLGAGAHIIYSGDFNFAAGSAGETGYIDLKAAPGVRLATNGVANSTAPGTIAGVAQAFDPLTNTFSNNSSASVKYYTEANDGVFGRYDLQLLTGNTMPGSTAAGLQLVPNTYTSFGNNYYIGNSVATGLTLNGRIDTASNAALLGIPLSVLQDMVFATDHMPVVADYIITPEPGTMLVALLPLAVARRRRA